MRTNLTGTMWMCREMARKMIRRGVGSMLIVGSTAQYHRAPGEVAYDASKAGLASYAETLAVELAPHGIRVNMLVPGSFATRLNPVATGRLRERLLAEIPLGRQGRPSECGPAAVFLLSDQGLCGAGEGRTSRSAKGCGWGFRRLGRRQHPGHSW